MTFVGKILVIVIMALALLFLGISSVAFTTAKNWKEAHEAEKKKVSELDSKLKDFQGKVDLATKELDKSKADRKAAVDALEKRNVSLEEEKKRELDTASDARAKLEVAQQSAKTALDEGEARRKETDQLREQKSAIEKQANDYKIQQTELNDRIRELERMNTSLDANTKDLRDRVARFSTLLRRAGLSDDISVVKGLESPPPVEGQVTRIDALNKRIEISIGSDDGLVPGHELFLYRLQPEAVYLGKVQVLTVDPDQSVCKVIGTTVQGKKIKEGDIVSTSTRPRS